MNFSQRMGLEPTELPLQIDCMSDVLRNSLWNFILSHTKGGEWQSLLKLSYQHFLYLPVDEAPKPFIGYSSSNDSCCHDDLKSKYFGLKWNQVYDFLEFYITVLSLPFRSDEWQWQKEYKQIEWSLNFVLDRGHSGFRMVEGLFAPITDENELNAVRDALTSAKSKHGNIHTHLKDAIKFLGEKPTPNYRNSIKESISAVEGLCKMLTNEKSGGIDTAIEKLAKQIEMHPAMKEGFKKLYDYTSDEDGIRHPILDEATVGLAEAKYMLVTCSAFVYFVIMKLPPEEAH